MELRMSVRERDRLKLMRALVEGRMKQGQAAELLGISVRQVQRIVRRYRLEGDKGLVHQSRGQPSKRKIPGGTVDRAVKCIGEQYGDFGPTLAAEKLAEGHGIQVSPETVRKWMIKAGLWKPRRARVHHRQWRQRKACRGEMVQMDTSIHAWFEGRSEEDPVLIAMVDDATSRLYARFHPTDSTLTNMAMLQAYIHRYGRPVAIYADQASHFKCTEKRTIADELAGREAETQIGRAFRELDIRYIAAHSPQAKGRVERAFGTLQDRLVKELRLRHISTIKAANEYLEKEFLPSWNRRFGVKPASSVNAHRLRKGFDLEAILSIQEDRIVANDYTIRYNNRVYQIERQHCSRGLRRARVTVEQRLDKKVRIRWQGRYLDAPPVVKTQPRPMEMTACGQAQQPPCPQALDNSKRELSTIPQA